MQRPSQVSPVDVKLEPWAVADAKALVQLGDDREIWLNLRDRFPRPFTRAAADLWLAEHIADHDAKDWRHKSFAVWWRDQLTGGVHLWRREDVHRICADLTFWIGRPFWGRGIAKAAVAKACVHAFDVLGLERVQAFVFEWKADEGAPPERSSRAASRALEDAGFTLEGRLRSYVARGGQHGDALLYALLRSEQKRGR